MFNTPEDAVAQAEKDKLGGSIVGYYHVYVYRIGKSDQYDLKWLMEDKYVYTHLPDQAHVVLHGTVKWDFNETWERSLVWERRGALSQADRDTLGDFSAFAERLINNDSE